MTLYVVKTIGGKDYTKNGKPVKSITKMFDNKKDALVWGYDWVNKHKGQKVLYLYHYGKPYYINYDNISVFIYKKENLMEWDNLYSICVNPCESKYDKKQNKTIKFPYPNGIYYGTSKKYRRLYPDGSVGKLEKPIKM